MKRLTMVLSALAFTATAAPLLAQGGMTPPAVHVANGMLTDAKGMTLYTYDRDTVANKSACVAQCAKNWPVLKATADDKDMGDWKVITLDDGSKAWTWKGKPLYYFAQDKAPGDKAGDNRGKVWHVAKP
jgi:predicted lipoprotein with Yx(FWY)xxD motif